MAVKGKNYWEEIL